MSDQPVALAGDQLSAEDVYAIWRIRDLVFAFEQRVEEPDADGIDLLPTTTHLWFADEAGLTSYLRSYLDDSGTRRVGRVATRADCRGRGLSTTLLADVHRRWGDQEIRLAAQAQLERWYRSLGYQRCGEDFMEAGIPHVPMRRLGQDTTPDRT